MIYSGFSSFLIFSITLIINRLFCDYFLYTELNEFNKAAD